MDAHATKGKVVGFALCDILKANWRQGNWNLAGLRAPFPDLEDARDVIRLSVDHEGILGQFPGIHQVEFPRNGFLHAGLPKRTRENKANPVRTTGCVAKEVFRQRCLPTERRVSEDHTAFGEVHLQEVRLSNARVPRLDVVAHGFRNKFQEDTGSRRWLHPGNRSRRVLSKQGDALPRYVGSRVELVFAVSTKSRILGHAVGLSKDKKVRFRKLPARFLSNESLPHLLKS